MYTILCDALLNKQKDQPIAFSLQPQLCNSLAREGKLLPENNFPLVFRISADAILRERREYIDTDTLVGGKLISPRVKDLLIQVGASFQSFPAQVLAEETGEILSPDFSFLIAEEHNDLLDWQLSKSWVIEETGTHYLTTAVFKEEKDSMPVLFRVSWRNHLLVTEQVQNVLKKKKVVGMAFAPLEAWFDPWIGVELTALQQKVLKQPDQAKLWYEIAVRYHSLYQFEKALTAIETALAFDATSDQAWFLKGCLLQTLKRQEEALVAHQKAAEIALPQRRQTPLYECCAILNELGQHQKALELAQQNVQDAVFPQVRPLWYYLGISYEGVGDYQKALLALEDATKYLGSPPEPLLFRALGDVYTNMGKLELALETYERGLVYMPIDEKLWQRKLSILQALGKEQECFLAMQTVKQLEEQRMMKQKERPY